MPTVYALSFIAVLLVVAWLMDHRARRIRRGLVRPASLRFGRRWSVRINGDLGRIAPGTAARPVWHDRSHHTP